MTIFSFQKNSTQLVFETEFRLYRFRRPTIISVKTYTARRRENALFNIRKDCVIGIRVL